MKKLMLSSLAVGFVLTSGSAFAADLSRPVPAYKAAPLPPPAVSWTGCYINGGVGYGLWNQSHTVSETIPGLGVTTVGPANVGGEGWLGRLGAGCDYQVSRFVIGVFGDYDFMNLHGNFAELSSLGGQENESAAWAVGGRIGYLVTPSLLTFFDGGYTQARFDQINFNSIVSPNPFPGATGLSIAAQTYNGWFIGGGTEYAISDLIPIHGLFWRTEYRYARYSTANVALSCLSAGTICPSAGFATGLAESMQTNVQTITSGIVWRFNFGQ